LGSDRFNEPRSDGSLRHLGESKRRRDRRRARLQRGGPPPRNNTEIEGRRRLTVRVSNSTLAQTGVWRPPHLEVPP
jgi:hypothetical protein